MMRLGRYLQELAYRYVPNLDDLIFLFFGGDIRDEGEVCLLVDIRLSFFYFVIDNIHIRNVPQYLYLSRVSTSYWGGFWKAASNSGYVGYMKNLLHFSLVEYLYAFY